MKLKEAQALDNGEYYINLDDDTGYWCVFGDTSGYVYFSSQVRKECSCWVTNKKLTELEYQKLGSNRKVNKVE